MAESESQAFWPQKLIKICVKCYVNLHLYKNWSRNLKLGRESCKHKLDERPSKTVVTQENINNVHNVVLPDRRIIVKLIAEACDFSVGSVKTILHDRLDLKRKLQSGYQKYSPEITNRFGN